jgi:Zn-dependent peptidase ImmA (M78 family)
VALRTEAYFRAVAAEALERAGCVEPPVSVESIAGSLGIPVRYVNLPAFFTSALVSEDGLPVMVVNWAKPELDRRSAVAHMLGHVLLVLDGDKGYPRQEPDHRDADSIARELVLPTSMVVDQARLWFNDYRYLARLFGVAEVTMLERMKEMGLIKGPDGVLWDY